MGRRREKSREGKGRRREWKRGEEWKRGRKSRGVGRRGKEGGEKKHYIEVLHRRP